MADQVFISYARKDGQEFAFKLHDNLEAKGISAWMDKRGGIREGRYWDKEIEEAIKACKVLLFVVTPGGVNSENCHDEWAYALSLKKPVLPLMFIQADIPMRLNRIQYTDFSNTKLFSTPLDKLLNRLRDHVVVDMVPQNQEASNGKPTVFICYSRKDQKHTEEVAGFLRTHGYIVWTDISATTGGVDWHSQIEAALHQCDAMIIMWSEAAKKSQWVRKEMLYAQNIDKLLVPVQLDKTPLPLALIDLQPLDYTMNQSQTLDELLRALPSIEISSKRTAVTSEREAHIDGMSLRDFRRHLEQDKKR